MIDNLAVLRVLDKMNRLGPAAVRDLLTTGRRDDSGAWTGGCGLSGVQADLILEFMKCTEGARSDEHAIARMRVWFDVMTMPPAGLDALRAYLVKRGAMAEGAAP